MDTIVIRGAREHNLKNIDLDIPRNKLVVITGVSGSGKSSLAFDTLYAEGQRRYVESLSAYARQFLEQMERPDVDSIVGLPPTIAVGQKGIGQNPRSTVGTMTEIYDFLRLLFARIGKPYCDRCQREISATTIQEVVDQLLSLPENTSIHILAPVAAQRRGDFSEELRELARAGFVRAFIDGQLHDLSPEMRLAKGKRHDVDLLVDRLAIKKGVEKRLADSLEVASRYGNELIKIVAFSREGEKSTELLFSQRFRCAGCGASFPELSPRLFSFNSPHGACPACGGLGVKTDESAQLEELIQAAPCAQCGGTRLKKESRQVRIGERNIAEVSALPIKNCLEFFERLTLGPRDQVVGARVIKEIRQRLKFMVELGVGYLSLDRPTLTLSGGEAQRIRLATQIGLGLSGVLYILDEPSIGLHPRDHTRLLALLKQLRDSGNSLLVVEHDRETILQADYVVDMGPGAGENGGEVVAQGTPAEIMASPRSLTGQYLSGQREVPIPVKRRKSRNFLVLKGARLHNLKRITVEFPIGAMTCVTGVSGSGKSSLVVDTLYRALAGLLYGKKADGRYYDEILGWEHFNRVVSVDQTPIGRTPRSNPATYVGLFDHLRDLFAQLPEARVRGYRPGRFSFNVKGGRCEACKGQGVAKIEMQFLPDIFVTCEFCAGRRYNRETLALRFKGRSIADVLNMTVNQAVEFLGNIPPIRGRLEALRAVGLGYLRLGQSATTLSGGEAQRVKLARELAKQSPRPTLYILDEPTTGLHFEDIKKLLDVLNRLIEQKNTVIIIEHNPDVVGSADFVVDLGPEGGDQGGWVIASGTPEEICMIPESQTGRVLKPLLEKSQYRVILAKTKIMD